MHRLMEFDQQLLAATEVHEISMLSHLHSERPATDEINTVDLSSYKGKCQTHSWRPYRACACKFRTDNTENAPLRLKRSTASQCGQRNCYAVGRMQKFKKQASQESWKKLTWAATNMLPSMKWLEARKVSTGEYRSMFHSTSTHIQRCFDISHRR